jgi:hypothetical protein
MQKMKRDHANGVHDHPPPKVSRPHTTALSNFLGTRIVSIDLTRPQQVTVPKVDVLDRAESPADSQPAVQCASTKKWLTVAQLTEAHKSFTENSIRYLIYASKPRKRSIRSAGWGDIPANGLASAIKRIGRKVLIDELAFMQWLDSH